MAFRFRKRVKIAKGVYLNFSKSGVSTSVGGRGLTYNSRGRVTAGIPGTGISQSVGISGRRNNNSNTTEAEPQGCNPAFLIVALAVILAIIFPPILIVYLLILGVWYSGHQQMKQAEKDYAEKMARKERIRRFQESSKDESDDANT